MTRKLCLCIFFAFSSFLALSCEEDFNPKGEVTDKYILNCIIRGDTTVQTAFLSKNYTVDGYDPLTNTTDPSVRKAVIKVWEGDSVYIFKEGTFIRSDSSRYGSKGYCYNTKYLPSVNKPIEIEALLPNGKRLKGSTKIPSKIFIDYTHTDTICPPVGKNNVFTAWISDETSVMFLPLFKLIYFKNVNGTDVRYEKPIPIGYKNKDGKSVAIYPKGILTSSYAYDMEAINRAMRDISEGDPNKDQYKILSLIIEITVLDRNLSAFYSSGHLQSDGYSITVDQADFTNITGGLGIFGSYIKRVTSIRISKDYIKSFGYKSALEL